MKKTNTKPKRKRNTITQRISKSNDADAITLALHGREITPVESAVSDYLRMLEAIKDRVQRVNGFYIRGGVVNELVSDRAGEVLASLMLKAVAALDDKKLHHIAKFLKECAKSHRDEARFRILAWKRKNILRGEPVTAQKLAQIVRYSEDKTRKLAQKLGYPLAKGRVGKPPRNSAK